MPLMYVYLKICLRYVRGAYRLRTLHDHDVPHGLCVLLAMLLRQKIHEKVVQSLPGEREVCQEWVQRFLEAQTLRFLTCERRSESEECQEWVQRFLEAQILRFLVGSFYAKSEAGMYNEQVTGQSSTKRD